MQAIPRSGRRRALIFAALGLGLLIPGILTLLSRVPYSADALRRRVVETLSERLEADVDLAGLELDVAPRMRAVGTGLVIRHRGHRDVPPLISVDRFTVDADLLGLWRDHVSYVKLEGLSIQVPPDDDDDTKEPAADRARGPHLAGGRQIVIDVLEAPDACLIVLRRAKHKTPRTWYLHELRMESVGANTAMPFAATLTNAVPPGTIKTTGTFGPWHRDDPGHTPLEGTFTFNDADLSVFKGISGILSAHGDYGGSLERIDVNGETETPDFTITSIGNAVPLKTKYRAVVDATNGNTTLDRIDASFLQTSLVAKGGVYEIEGVKGREVKLDVTMDEARLDDVIRLAVQAPTPPMTGGLRLTTEFHLPPGDEDVVDKLALNGRFSITNGRFTNREIQQKINEMSLRASGRLNTSHATSEVGSDFTGRFQLRRGTLTLPTLVFDIPGAAVRLRGWYALRREALDFRGTLIMDARVSQTVTGWKSWLLKVADPLFRRDGQTLVPIKITGTRDRPSFGIEPGRIFRRPGGLTRSPGASTTQTQRSPR